MNDPVIIRFVYLAPDLHEFLMKGPEGTEFISEGNDDYRIRTERSVAVFMGLVPSDDDPNLYDTDIESVEELIRL